jgi:hypothetical protein
MLLLQLWRTGKSYELGRFSAWAISSQPLLDRDALKKEPWDRAIDAFLGATADKSGDDYVERMAALVLAWYRRAPWNDEDLAAEFDKIETHGQVSRTLRDVLLRLGAPGQSVLGKLQTKLEKLEKMR